MEAKCGGKRQEFYGPVVSDMKGVGEGSSEWDLNKWKWDGDLFVASQSSSVSVDCRSRQLFDVRPEAPGNVGSDCRGRQFFPFRAELLGNVGLVGGSSSRLEDASELNGGVGLERHGNSGLACSRGLFPLMSDIPGSAGLFGGSSSRLEYGDVRPEAIRDAGLDCKSRLPGNPTLVAGSSSCLESGNVPNEDVRPEASGNSALDCMGRQLFPFRPEIPASAGLVCGSSSSLGDPSVLRGDARKELDKRKRDGDVYHEPGSLILRLGGQDFSAVDEDAQGGKKSRIVGCSSNRPVCQVDDCRADLSNAKDYHRRHKVCELHSKASQALVVNVMQRFCQQCSRFHDLQEFDEGKRSCRRRLEGHNRRRRKAHPDTITNDSSVNEGSSGNYLLNSLLRILSSTQSSNSDQTRDQDLLSHLLNNLGGIAGAIAGDNTSGLAQGSQGSLNVGTPAVTLKKTPNVNTSGPALSFPSSTSIAPNVQYPLRITGECTAGNSSLFEQNGKGIGTAQDGRPLPVHGLQATKLLTLPEGTSCEENVLDSKRKKTQLNDIDLNSVYDGSQDRVENLVRLKAPVDQTISTRPYPLLIQRDDQKLSAPHTSVSSESTSTQSASTSTEETRSRTERIVFKLFGKDPNDLPFDLRTKILNWLSNSPTDIESYIRPGCVILTIYLRLQRPCLEELCCNFRSHLNRLLNASDDLVWKTGWVYTRIKHTVVFIYNGQVVLDTPLPLEIHHSHRILSIKPIAVPASEKAQFIVKGVNLCHSTRLLCALEGKYLVQQSCDYLESEDSLNEHNGLQHLSFDCTIPKLSGRGFIEVEDLGLGGSFFPFIVAEQEVCSEIRTLEYAIELAETALDVPSDEIDVKNKALDFIDEMGWLLHRYHLNIRLGDMNPSLSLFSFNRFRWLMEFSMDHDWCAVVKKLLIIFLEGTIDSGEHSSAEGALLGMGLLHKAVQRNYRPMVELLLRFSPDKRFQRQTTEQKENDNSGPPTLFRPDARGPGSLTPLHLAASVDGSEDVLDALTDDPGLIGIQAWQSARDDMGFTPNDYASMRGLIAYIHLVQQKIKEKRGYVVVDIPTTDIGSNIKQNLSDGLKSGRVSSFNKEKIDSKTIQKSCSLCQHNMVYVSNRTTLVYKPAVLLLLSIAAVCVCVALLFKSSPEVLYVGEPFRWESLKYGPV